MTDNIKEKIAYESRTLFNTYGYPKVTMRQIAAACGISVGNLTYYYPRKEDLLMLEHDGILIAFLDKVLEDESKLSGLRGYFTVECAFLHRILNDPPVSHLYSQVINVPTLRERYCRAHHALYRHFVPDAPEDGPAWNATVAMSGLEFELADEGILQADFARAMTNVFRTRMLFANGETPEDLADIRAGVAEGIALSLHLANAFSPDR